MPPAPRAARSERGAPKSPPQGGSGLGSALGNLTTTSVPLVGNPDMRVRRTIAAMRAVVFDSLKDPRIVERAATIVRNVDGRDRLGQIRALRSWLASNVKFLPDPLIDGDVIRTPALLLRQFDRDGVIRGDCDDVATLTATLGHAVGVPGRFVTLAFNGPTAPFQHVYTELQDNAGDWHEMDVTETARTRATQQPTRREAHDVLGPTVVPSLAGVLAFVQALYLGYRALEQIGRALDDGTGGDDV